MVALALVLTLVCSASSQYASLQQYQLLNGLNPQTSGNQFPNPGSSASVLNGLGATGVNSGIPQTGLPTNLGSLSGAFPTSNCKTTCEDKSPICDRFKSQCLSVVGLFYIRNLCPFTCGACTQCPVSFMPCSPDCADNTGCILMAKDCRHSQRGWLVRRSCPQTCGKCRPCMEPPVTQVQAKSCSNNCKDERTDCGFLANTRNYCSLTSEYREWMQVKCRKSCGLCTKCGSSVPVVQPQPASGASGSALRPPSGALSSLLRPPSVPGLSNLFPQGFPFPRTTTTQSPTTTTNRRTTTTQRLTTTTPPPINPVPTTSSDGTCTLQMGRTVDEQCLYTHNYYRCLHGVPPLRLSSELKSSAQYYANSMAADGKLGYHSLKPSVIGIERAATVGENLAWRMQPNNRYNIEQAAADWYAEGLYYDYNQPESSTKEHFTQMIWKDTTEVGCAVSQIGAQIYAVAQYKLAGNIPGLYADNVKTTTARVCQAHCSMGRCQGHDGMSSTCLCQTRRMALPSCTGNCVVYCPKPESHAGYWETRCAGKRMCRCDAYRRGGRHPGAVCN